MHLIAQTLQKKCNWKSHLGDMVVERDSGSNTLGWGAFDGMSDSQSVVTCMAPIWMNISWMVSIDTVIILEYLSSVYKHYMYIMQHDNQSYTLCWRGMKVIRKFIMCF